MRQHGEWAVGSSLERHRTVNSCSMHSANCEQRQAHGLLALADWHCFQEPIKTENYSLTESDGCPLHRGPAQS